MLEPEPVGTMGKEPAEGGCPDASARVVTETAQQVGHVESYACDNYETIIYPHAVCKG
jgi:hypothetical protein